MTRLLYVLLGLVAPPLAALLWLSRHMPLDRAFVGTLGSWVGTVNAELLSQPFYRWCVGTDDVTGNLALLATWLGWYGLLVGPAAAVALRVKPGGGSSRFIRAALVFTTNLTLVLTNPFGLDLLDAGRPLPLLVPLAGVVPCLALFRARGQAERPTQAARQLSMVVFALFLMSKMLLNARLYHYGFVLAMPATFVLIIALTDWLPSSIRRAGGASEVMLAAGMALLLPGVAAHLRLQAPWVVGKTIRVGSGGDGFWADTRGRYVRRALSELNSRAAPRETLTAFPEGIMLNYLSRRVDPLPYTTFHTTELVLFGPQAILRAARSGSPDWVALVHKDTSELGYRFFGQDYARPLGRWVRANYRAEVCIGALPFQDEDFGILLLRRRSRPSPSPASTSAD